MIKAIFATDRAGGIGYRGSLPWPHDKEDLKRFKDLTTGHIVVIGSKTWIDPMLPKPLPNRTCVVVSNQSVSNFPLADEVISGHWLPQSLALLEDINPNKDIWIIGGAQLLTSCKTLIEKIELTTFMCEYSCDVKLNLVDFLEGFNKEQESFGRNKIYTKWSKK